MGSACGKGSVDQHGTSTVRRRSRAHSLRRMDTGLAGRESLKHAENLAMETDNDLSPRRESPMDPHFPLSPKKSFLLRRSQRLREATELLAAYLETEAKIAKSANVSLKDNRSVDFKKRSLVGAVYDVIDTGRNSVIDLRSLNDEFQRMGWLQGCQELKMLITPQVAKTDSWVDEVCPVSPQSCHDDAVKRTGAKPNPAKKKTPALNDIPAKRALAVSIPDEHSEWRSGNGSPSTSPRSASISRTAFIDAFLSIKALTVVHRNSEPRGESQLSPASKLRLQRQRRSPAVLKGYRIEPFCAYSKRIKCVRNREDCPLVAVCMKDAITAQVFNATTGSLERVYTGHCDCIFDMSISHDRKYLATASRDSTLIIWDLTCGYLVKQFSHPGAVTCCAFCDKQEIITGCYDSVVRKFDVSKGFIGETPEPEDSRGVIVTIISTPNIIALTRTRMVEVELLSYRTLLPLTCLTGHETLIWMLHSRPGNHDNLLSVCERKLNVWKGLSVPDGTQAALHCSIDVTKGERLAGRCTKESWLAAQFLQSPFDRHIIASSYDLAVSIFDIDGTQLLHFYHRYPIYCISTPGDECVPYLGDSAGNVLRLHPL